MSVPKPYANARRVLAQLRRWLEAVANDALFPSVYVHEPVEMRRGDVYAAHRRSARRPCVHGTPSRRSAPPKKLRGESFSTLSTCLLTVAVASAMASIVRIYEPLWPIVDWICGVSAVALVASLVRDARK